MENKDIWCQRMMDVLSKLREKATSIEAIHRIVDYTEKEVEGEEQEFLIALFIKAKLNPHAFYLLLKFSGDKKAAADHLKCPEHLLFEGGPKDAELNY